MKQYTFHRNVFSSLLLVFCLFLMLGGNCNSEQVKEQELPKVTSRDMKRSEAGKLSHTLGKLGEYKALIIGINKYQDPNIPELTTAEKDARSMAEVLEKQYGFQKPQLLLNKEADRSNIYNAFRTLSKESVSNDSILIYYAGHGNIDKFLGTGSWIPADALLADPATYIDNVLVQKFIRSMKAKHVLLISDSCYSGSLFGLTRTIPAQIDDKYYQRLYEDQSRWGLTSGNLEPVADGGKNGHSVFAYFLLKELSNPSKNYFATHELFSRIASVVANNSSQKPMCRPFQNVNDEGGQFVFVHQSDVTGKISDGNHAVSGGQQDQQARFVKAFNKLLFQIWDDSALSELSNLAVEGNPIASGYLATVNEFGLGGVRKNHKEAVLWGKTALEKGLEEEAKSGNTYAQAVLANLYLEGHGCEKDLKKAVIWMRKSAEEGNLYAISQLGLIYEKGRGVTQSDKEAVKWYRKAAEQGYAKGQVNLGRMYKDGLGVTQSYKEAVKWGRKAAEQGYSKGQVCLGWMYEKGLGVTQSDKEAVRWYRKAADQGDAEGQTRLSLMYREGQGVTQSDKEAVKWYRKAAEQGYSTGQVHLGWMYEKGRGVTQSDKEAVKWYRKAAEQEDLNGMNYLATMYRDGKGGLAKDGKEAAKWFRKAANQGFSDAQVNLGKLYENGHADILKDITKAIKWYNKAAKQGNTFAAERLKALENEIK